MAFIYREYPERSWSISSFNVFNQCKRKFYYSSYAHWNGWDITSTELSKQAYRLKKIEDIFTLSGTYIHDVIKEALQGRRMLPEEMNEAVLKKLREAVAQSLKSKDDWRRRPKNYIMLHEYYYGKKISDQQADEIKDRVLLCCTNLFKSQSYKELTEDPISIVELDQREEYNYFLHDDIKIYCTLDALYKHDDEIVIVDWKTGQPDDEQHKLQMLVYILYVLNKHGHDEVGKIRCVDEYLLTGERYTNIFDENDVDWIKGHISNCISMMNEYLEDINLNKPKDITAFPSISSNLCSRCNFIEICKESTFK